MSNNQTPKKVDADLGKLLIYVVLVFLAGIVLLFLVVPFIISIFSENFQGQSHPIKKWSCTEKGCELSINGKYDTQEECKRNGCKIKEHKHKNVKFAKELEKYYYF